MSWYKDFQLFIYSFTSVIRVTKEFGINPILISDFNEQEELNFSKHLSLVNNKESDFDDFKASFPTYGIYKLTNSQGLVINWDQRNGIGTWSREERSSPFWSLPGIEQALKGRVLEAKIFCFEEENKRIKKEKEALEAEKFILRAELSKERDEKSVLINGLRTEDMLASLEALEKQVSDLTSKLVKCCGAAGGGLSVEEPWITGHAVPNNWVRFEDLDVLAFSENTPLKITKATGGPVFGNDNTTNVRANRFYHGVFPIVVVDIAGLTPNREEVRFDPYVWGFYNNAGISYAARKPFASEI
ncbi:hypothetical protein MKX01_031695 [Papaver californicum]|nr:hypothetical protein MKX01_031695 [Papaver californicum]